MLAMYFKLYLTLEKRIENIRRITKIKETTA